MSGDEHGLPAAPAREIEKTSGLSMDDVRVHHSSDKPAQFQSLDHERGDKIHLGPGQEQHLPHEAWHVVQQVQERVQPEAAVEGIAVNDARTLEHEAEMMGERAIASGPSVRLQKVEP